MKNGIMTLICFITTTLFAVGCSGDSDKDLSLEDIALKEAKKITSEHGYSLKSESITEYDILIGDSEVFKLIKYACIKRGYSETGLNSMTEGRRIVGYELEEKSKEDEPIMLCLIIDNKKAIGAYLDYYA